MVARRHADRFSAKRETDEVNQIYVLDIGGGEAVRVTNISTGAAIPLAARR